MNDRTEIVSRDGPVRPRVGYEVRDIDVSGVVVTLGVLVIGGVFLLGILYGMYRSGLPTGDDVAVPTRMPGEPPVNDRVGSVPPPRLDGLKELKAEPPTYRTSEPVPGANPPQFHAEDLRADRQPRLQRYGWVDQGKGIAHIPIDRAMAIEADRLGKKGGGK